MERGGGKRFPLSHDLRDLEESRHPRHPATPESASNRFEGEFTADGFRTGQGSVDPELVEGPDSAGVVES